MTDCPNGEMRDRLPDLLHATLDADRRREVESHVTGCASCQTELELLRAARSALSHVPGVDSGRVVRAILRSTRRAAAVGRPVARSAWSTRDWRIAAVIAGLTVAGAGAYGALRGPAGSVPESGSRVIAAGESARTGANSLGTGESGAASRVADAGLRLASLAELDDDDIEALLAELDRLDGVPELEPPPVLLPVAEGTL